MRFLFLVLLMGALNLQAQVPVEVFSGNKNTTLDIMFFKFFNNKKRENSHWLFFNRNRASVDYKMTKDKNLPQFGFTEAISYNHPKLKGLAPVAVFQVLNRGVYPKAGIQYAKITADFTFFGWTVSELIKNPNLDIFILSRYTPSITEKMNLFVQAEFVNAFPLKNENQFSFTQRARLGLKFNKFQFGAGVDLNETGKDEFAFTWNTGGFLRYEF